MKPTARLANLSPGALVVIAYFSFISIGIQTSLLGIAWTGPEGPEYLSRTFRQPLDGVGQLLAAGTLGYFLVSAVSGRLVQRAQWVSLYWGSFTAGRILFGAIGERFVLGKLIKTCLLGALASSLLLVFSGAGALTPVAVVLFGVSISPIWAMLIVHTQRVLGSDHAPHAIGYQVAAASLGFGLIPSLAGVLADSCGLEVIPSILVGLTAWMVGLYAFDKRLSNQVETT